MTDARKEWLLDVEDIKKRMKYHPPANESTQMAHEAVRELFLDMSLRVASAMLPSRERSLALTKLEEALFWVNAGIARNHE
jgi:hypothetical protein